MLLLRWDNELGEADLVRGVGQNLSLDPGLESAVVISLFTDRAPEPGDDVDDGEIKGWWADAFAEQPGFKLGSRLWRLRRAKLTEHAPSDAVVYAKEALAWMVEDGVASLVDAVAVVVRACVLGLQVAVHKPGESSPYIGYWEVPYGVQ